MLSSVVARKYGLAGLPDDTIQIKLMARQAKALVLF